MVGRPKGSSKSWRKRVARYEGSVYCLSNLGDRRRRVPALGVGLRRAVRAMKTLFITPQVPWPLDVGSKIRVHNLLRCYAEMGEVTLVCFAQDQVEAESVQQLERYCHRVYWLPLSASELRAAPATSRFGVLRRAMHPQPWAVRYFSSAELARRVGSLVDGEDIDVLHVERLSMTQNIGHTVRSRSGGRPPYLVLDVDDLESEKMRRMAALEPWGSPRKYLHSLEWLKLYAYERLVLPRFDCALVCSEKDRRRLQQGRRSPRIEVFCNGADLDDRTTPKEQQDDGRTLVFLGALDYQPNEDAVLFFTHAVLPLVRRRVPSVRFIIAGKSPSARVRALDTGHDVVVTGYVQDKAEVFKSCTIFVVPLRIGGGTRIKILEAMAAGKPVVSTTVGCEGLDVAPSENILVADAPENFADACVELLLHETRRQTLGRAGRVLVLRSYRWEEIRRGYVETLEDCRQGTGATALCQPPPPVPVARTEARW